MQKFNLVVEKREKEKLLSYLQERGDVEIVDIQTKKEKGGREHGVDPVRNLSGGRSSIARVTVTTQPQRVTREVSNGVGLTLAELDFVLDLLKERGKKEEKGFIKSVSKIFVGPKEITPKDFEKLSRHFDYPKVIEKAKILDNNLVKLETEERELEEDLEILKPWESLGITRPELETQCTLSILGVLQVRDLGNLKKVIDGEVNVYKVKEEGNNYYLVITYLKKNREKFLATLGTTGFTEVSLPREGIPQIEIQKIESRLKEIGAQKKTILSQIQKMVASREKIQMVYDYLSNKKKVWDAQTLACDTIYMSVISAWASRFTFRALKKNLPKKFAGIFIEKAKKEKGERVPVVIYNKKYLEPFESVTRIYGLPAYQELDPTSSLSLFFAVFFGMCLSDAGYGLILLVLSILGMKFLKLASGFKRFLKLIVYCSITTIMVGVLYGAYFSINLLELPESSLRSLLLSLQIVDPIKSPLKILIVAFLLGLLQGWFARVVNVKYLLSKKRIKDALLGDLVWVFAIPAIVFAGLSKFFFPAQAKIGLYTVIGFAALLVLTQGYQKKNIILKFFSGLLSLYKIVGIISDLLSYSRLLALGLTTSIIGLVINVIALLARDMIPYVGILVMILILIAGHIFNMGINILGGFIHSARLQFVEFFPKFMEGGGRMFKPLKKEYKFTKIKEENF